MLWPVLHSPTDAFRSPLSNLIQMLEKENYHFTITLQRSQTPSGQQRIWEIRLLHVHYAASNLTPARWNCYNSTSIRSRRIDIGAWWCNNPLSGFGSWCCCQRCIGDFCMLDGPTSTIGQFGHYIVAVAEECDVEVDVVGWFARDVDLRHLFVDIVGTVEMLVSDWMLRNERKRAYISETGATFMDVPITMIRSTMAASCSVSLSKNRLGSFSPKKVMLG